MLTNSVNLEMRCFPLIILSYAMLKYCITMPRRTEEDTSMASAEALKGGIVGAAKVISPQSLHPQLPAAPVIRN